MEPKDKPTSTMPAATSPTESAAAAEPLFNSKKVIILSGLVLGLFSLLTMGLAGLFYQGTYEAIRLSEERHEQEILQNLVQLDAQDVRFVPQTWNDGSIKGYLIMPATATGDPADSLGRVFEANSPDGYNGAIDLLVGVGTDGKLISVGVVKHRETPGLGDKIERSKSPWLDQFKGLSLTTTNWAVRKQDGDFDSLTGATISSNAVITGVQQALSQAQDAVLDKTRAVAK